MKATDLKLASPEATQHLLAADDRWILVNRIVSCPGFARAAQLRELLLFLSHHVITNPMEELSEQEIGCRVLGRRPDYDTQSDNIVRVQVRHLRQKLEEYYANDGRTETLLLSIPKGGRVPHFELRPIPEPTKAPLFLQPMEPPPAPPQNKRRTGLFICLAMLVVATGAYFVGRLTSHGPAPIAAGGRDLSRHLLWSRMFKPDTATTVVISDSSLVFIQDMLHVNLNLQEITSGSLRGLINALPDEKLRASLLDMSGRQYTSMADATVSSRLVSIGNAMDSKVAVRYSRHMGIRDFNEGNFIIVGSKRGIPWVELFEPDLNFLLQMRTPSREFVFRNKSPLKGEADIYRTIESAAGSYETYATLAFLPNQKRTGSTLLLEGIMMEGTEAAGEFALSDACSQLLSARFGTSALRDLPPFEILLKIQVVGRAPRKVEVVAWRRPGSN